ncbi:hypothetical protein NADE_004441 [Nannochloris sp. 'desiccata']|nr:hypothetical protein NADE_004441 [Chlorella desiccata (nom. nud.)]
MGCAALVVSPGCPHCGTPVAGRTPRCGRRKARRKARTKARTSQSATSARFLSLEVPPRVHACLHGSTVKIKIPVDKSGVPTAEIYNEAKELVSLDSITKGSSITCLLELAPVWFVNKTFGLTWKLVQAAVTPGPQNITGYSILEEQEDW